MLAWQHTTISYKPTPPMAFEQTKTKSNIHLSTMDLWVRATMKNAAKRDM